MYESIYIPQYPRIGKEQKAVVAYGILKEIENIFELKYYCSTSYGSSGSPIISLSHLKIIGIHKVGDSHFKFNKGTFLKNPINEFLDSFKKEYELKNTNIDKYKSVQATANTNTQILTLDKKIEDTSENKVKNKIFNFTLNNNSHEENKNFKCYDIMKEDKKYNNNDKSSSIRRYYISRLNKKKEKSKKNSNLNKNIKRQEPQYINCINNKEDSLKNNKSSKNFINIKENCKPSLINKNLGVFSHQNSLDIIINNNNFKKKENIHQIQLNKNNNIINGRENIHNNVYFNHYNKRYLYKNPLNKKNNIINNSGSLSKKSLLKNNCHIFDFMYGKNHNNFINNKIKLINTEKGKEQQLINKKLQKKFINKDNIFKNTISRGNSINIKKSRNNNYENKISDNNSIIMCKSTKNSNKKKIFGKKFQNCLTISNEYSNDKLKLVKVIKNPLSLDYSLNSNKKMGNVNQDSQNSLSKDYSIKTYNKAFTYRNNKELMGNKIQNSKSKEYSLKTSNSYQNLNNYKNSGNESNKIISKHNSLDLNNSFINNPSKIDKHDYTFYFY